MGFSNRPFSLTLTKIGYKKITKAAKSSFLKFSLLKICLKTVINICVLNMLKKSIDENKSFDLPSFWIKVYWSIILGILNEELYLQKLL